MVHGGTQGLTMVFLAFFRLFEEHRILSDGYRQMSECKDCIISQGGISCDLLNLFYMNRILGRFDMYVVSILSGQLQCAVSARVVE